MTTEDKHKLVIDEWFNNGWHGAKAYLHVYSGSKSDNHAAASRFNEIVKKSEIRLYMKEKHKDAETLARTTHEALLKELKNWAYADTTKFLTIDFEEIPNLPESIRRLITGFKKITFDTKDKDGSITSTRTTVELKFASKEKAMEMIHKHLGFYGEHNKQKNTKDMTDEELDKRIAELQLKLNQHAESIDDLL